MLSDKYTTLDKISNAKGEDKIKEEAKTQLTNDGYAIAEVLEIYLRRLHG